MSLYYIKGWAYPDYVVDLIQSVPFLSLAPQGVDSFHPSLMVFRAQAHCVVAQALYESSSSPALMLINTDHSSPFLIYLLLHLCVHILSAFKADCLGRLFS